MLTDYKGPSNNNELLRHLVGETIKAAFIVNEVDKVIVFGSGMSVVFAGNGAYWPESVASTNKMIAIHKAKIEREMDEIRGLSVDT